MNFRWQTFFRLQSTYTSMNEKMKAPYKIIHVSFSTLNSKLRCSWDPRQSLISVYGMSLFPVSNMRARMRPRTPTGCESRGQIESEIRLGNESFGAAGRDKRGHYAHGCQRTKAAECTWPISKNPAPWRGLRPRDTHSPSHPHHKAEIRLIQ